MKIDYNNVIRYSANTDNETLVDIVSGYATRPYTWVDSPDNKELISQLKVELSKMTGIPTKALDKISYVCENSRVWLPIQYTAPEAILNPDVNENNELIWHLCIAEPINPENVTDDMRLTRGSDGLMYRIYDTHDFKCTFSSEQFKEAYSLLLKFKDKANA